MVESILVFQNEEKNDQKIQSFPEEVKIYLLFREVSIILKLGWSSEGYDNYKDNHEDKSEALLKEAFFGPP